MWDLSSPTRDRTGIPCIARRILNHWTTRKVPEPLTLDRLMGFQFILKFVIIFIIVNDDEMFDSD